METNEKNEECPECGHLENECECDTCPECGESTTVCDSDCFKPEDEVEKSRLGERLEQLKELICSINLMSGTKSEVKLKLVTEINKMIEDFKEED